MFKSTRRDALRSDFRDTVFSAPADPRLPCRRSDEQRLARCRRVARRRGLLIGRSRDGTLKLTPGDGTVVRGLCIEELLGLTPADGKAS